MIEKDVLFTILVCGGWVLISITFFWGATLRPHNKEKSHGKKNKETS